jgi:hypothetical protein
MEVSLDFPLGYVGNTVSTAATAQHSAGNGLTTRTITQSGGSIGFATVGITAQTIRSVRVTSQRISRRTEQHVLGG